MSQPENATKMRARVGAAFRFRARRMRRPGYWWSPLKIGLTGGMGCGKSTVGRYLESLGWGRVDSDAVVHELLAGDAETIGDVVAAFGSDVLLPDGGVDRAKVGALVFGSPDKLAQLESILHPRVRQRWEAALASGGDWVVEIPLLFEKKLQKNVDLTVCVFCHSDTQVERLEKRGMDRTQALARIGRQMPLSEKAELADHVLLNDGPPSYLAAQVDRLLSQLKNP